MYKKYFLSSFIIHWICAPMYTACMQPTITPLFALDHDLSYLALKNKYDKLTENYQKIVQENKDLQSQFASLSTTGAFPHQAPQRPAIRAAFQTTEINKAYNQTFQQALDFWKLLAPTYQNQTSQQKTERLSHERNITTWWNNFFNNNNFSNNFNAQAIKSIYQSYKNFAPELFASLYIYTLFLLIDRYQTAWLEPIFLTARLFDTRPEVNRIKLQEYWEQLHEICFRDIISPLVLEQAQLILGFIAQGQDYTVYITEIGQKIFKGTSYNNLLINLIHTISETLFKIHLLWPQPIIHDQSQHDPQYTCNPAYHEIKQEITPEQALCIPVTPLIIMQTSPDAPPSPQAVYKKSLVYLLPKQKGIIHNLMGWLFRKKKD